MSGGKEGTVFCFGLVFKVEGDLVLAIPKHTCVVIFCDRITYLWPGQIGHNPPTSCLRIFAVFKVETFFSFLQLSP